jgi:hypothetical protein
MVGPEAFWAMTISIVAYSIIGPDRFLIMWKQTRRFVGWWLGEGQ